MTVATDLDPVQLESALQNVDYVAFEWKNTRFAIQKRPSYCDRGQYLLHAYAIGSQPIHLDRADGFPRYYFEMKNLVSELNAWMRKREESLVSA